ncbi:MAG: phenylalanine--tRNA ligase subunit alpha, partial [Gemmatimonadetes bacterium]|nr:phenylalanine--tRNA ligase subunit alpha [Gemmatimonadota bacterium]
MSDGSSVEIVEEVKAGALDELATASDEEKLEQWRIAYLGRSGRLTQVLRGLGALGQSERRAVGAAANAAKSLLQDGLERRRGEIKAARLSTQLERERIDVTLPGWPAPQGRLHPVTQTLREIEGAFVSMGFRVEEGPEVEWDRYNFDMLNIPKDHPARDMWDTLWIDHTNDHGERSMLLRTHTSPMQVRIMEKVEPPVRVIVPGKVYRYEATDA